MTDQARVTAALAASYRVDHELGAGGMATVYLAEDVKHRRQVAVKVLKPTLAAAIGPERFLREIRVTAQLNHPHILPLLDSGEADALLYYVMPFVDGESLRDRLHRETQLPLEDAVTVTRQVADALDYAHRHDVIHRDIKPENILLHDGKALVADFGIAVAFHAAGETRLTETGLSVGTPQYMSPEQAAGDRALNGRSDIYSLGCVLYEMLAGEPPHTGPTTQAILAKIATDEPRDIAELRKTLPEHVAAVVRTALAKLPADRFQAAAELGRELEQPHPISRPRRLAKGHQVTLSRGLVTFFAVVLALALALAGWALLRPVERDRDVIRMLVELPNLANNDGSASTVTPDGRRILYTTPDGLYVRDLRHLDSRMIYEGRARSPVMSPDGEWVAWFGNGLYKMPLDGGEAVTITQSVSRDGGFYGGHWTRDGHVYFSPGSGSPIMRVNVNGGDVEPVTILDPDLGELDHRFPHVVAGGLLYASWRASPRPPVIMAKAFGTEGAQPVAEGTTPTYISTGHLLYVGTNGNLHMLPFDPDRLEAKGSPVSLSLQIFRSTYGRAHYSVSNDGVLTYEREPRGEGLVLFDNQGRERRAFPELAGVLDGPRISPDGSRVAVARLVNGKRTIWVYSFAGDSPSQVTDVGNDFFPAWTPDGRFLAFASDRNGPWALFRKRADGVGPAELLLGGETSKMRPDWSWDGESLVYQDYRPGADLWVLDLASPDRPRLLVESPTLDAGRYSPTGPFIGYRSGPDVYVTDLRSSERIIVSDERPASHVVWSSDGRRLYYHADGALTTVDIVTEPSLGFSNRLTLFEIPRLFDVMPDGSGFIAVKTVNESPPISVVVLNWFEELRALLDEAN